MNKIIYHIIYINLMISKIVHVTINNDATKIKDI